MLCQCGGGVWFCWGVSWCWGYYVICLFYFIFCFVCVWYCDAVEFYWGCWGCLWLVDYWVCWVCRESIDLFDFVRCCMIFIFGFGWFIGYGGSLGGVLAWGVGYYDKVSVYLLQWWTDVIVVVLFVLLVWWLFVLVVFVDLWVLVCNWVIVSMCGYCMFIWVNFCIFGELIEIVCGMLVYEGVYIMFGWCGICIGWMFVIVFLLWVVVIVCCVVGVN